MAVTLNNLANIAYNYGTSTDRAVSNVVTTSLNENYSLIAEKISYNDTFRPGENLTYSVRIENTGIEPIYGVSVQDNLGGTNRLLNYVLNSAKMFRNDQLTDIVPTSTSPLTLELPDALIPGEVVIFNYIGRVISDIGSSVNEITNEANVIGHKNSVSGEVITVNPVPTATVTKSLYAMVRIEKSVDKENVSVNDQLTYTFRLENSGNTVANNVVLTDNLPAKFQIDSITSRTNGVETTFIETDYSIDENNRLTLPTSVTKTISVPSSTELGPGLTIITIIGTITE